MGKMKGNRGMVNGRNIKAERNRGGLHEKKGREGKLGEGSVREQKRMEYAL